ncbi:hypothetical protein BH10PSE4_BH10PSE4_42130 [soil metagenome]
MILSALLLAILAPAAPTPSMGEQIGPGPATFHPSHPQAVEAVKAREACRAPGVELAVNVAPTTEAAIQKLGDLPPANHTLTVLRSVDGCPVSSTVRFNVDQPAGR